MLRDLGVTILYGLTVVWLFWATVLAVLGQPLVVAVLSFAAIFGAGFLIVKRRRGTAWTFLAVLGAPLVYAVPSLVTPSEAGLPIQALVGYMVGSGSLFVQLVLSPFLPFGPSADGLGTEAVRQDQ